MEVFEALPADMRAKLQRTFRLVEERGLAALVMPLARPVVGRTLLVLRTFIKKTPKTPRGEIDMPDDGLREKNMPRMKARDLHDKAMREDPEYRREYEALEEEFALIAAMLDARQKAGLTQAQVAERMGVKQPVVAKIEGGRSNVSFGTLKRYARATGCKVKVEFVQG